MARLIHPQFRDENTTSRYPFADRARLVTDTGHTLPEDLVIDAVLHPINNSLPLLLRRVELAGLVVSLIVGTASDDLCRADVDLTDPDGVVVLQDDLGRPAGVLLCDPTSLRLLRSWGNGLHTFAGTAEFVATVEIPSPEQGVRSLAAEVGDPFTGDVWLVGEDGVLITEEDGFVRIDIVGEPLWRQRLCDTMPTFQTQTFVQTINGIAPNSYGNWQLTPGRVLTDQPALRIYPNNGDLVVALALPE